MTTILLVLAACTVSGTGSGATAQGGGPAVTILEPAEGGVLPGSTVHVRIQVERFLWEGTSMGRRGLPLPIGTAWAETAEPLPEGHAVYRLDGVTSLAINLSEVDIVGVDPGEHRLEVELVDVEGQGFDPPAVDEVSFRTE